MQAQVFRRHKRFHSNFRPCEIRVTERERYWKFRQSVVNDRTLPIRFVFSCSLLSVLHIRFSSLAIMLTEVDKRQILSGIRYVYLLYNPVALDLSTGELSWSVPLRKRLICKVSYVFFLCHTIFKILRLLQTFVYEKETTELFEFILHINFVFAMVVIAFSYYFLFIQYPDIHAGIVKFSLSPRNHDGNNCSNSYK